MSLIRGDALSLPLADESVDLVVTSPPYFALRSYTDGGEHYHGQIGSEATPVEFVAALLEVTRECVRVLKPSGSLWVNLGDKYNSAASGQNGTGGTGLTGGEHDRMAGRGSTVRTMRPKSLMGLPWRYALGCIDDLGLILRAEVIWSKPNGLPESVTDRVRRSHEQWFHFTREQRYFSAVDEIREEHAFPLQSRTFTAGRDALRPERDCPPENNPLGKLPGSVWAVATEPLRVPDHLPQHFAAFPSEWPKRIIKGWSPSGICVECGQGRRPTVATTGLDESRPQARRALDLVAEHGLTDAHIAAIRSVGVSDTGRGAATQTGTGKNTAEVYALADEAREVLGGYAREFLLSRPTSLVDACACPTPDAPTRPAVVLDPFCGTGTTVLVANALGRYGIGLDLSRDYLDVAKWRINDPRMRAKVLRVEPPAKQIEGQGVLL